MTIGLTWRRTARRIKRLKETVLSISPDYSDRPTPDLLTLSNLAACCEILNVIAQDNQNDETRAAIRAVLAETAWYHGDLTSAVALMREGVEGYDRVGTTF